MNRVKIITIVDALMVIAFLLLATATLAMELDLDSNAIRFIHHNSGLALIALIVIHVLLHLRVLLGMVKSLFKK
jgi:hypothetical protein